ncbi:MAG TPA: hypothetical protein VK012_03040 [Gemmatimonadales bacterium]|nr:hypothetical protein [Gemmatimonadales bacterium]
MGLHRTRQRRQGGEDRCGKARTSDSPRLSSINTLSFTRRSAIVMASLQPLWLSLVQRALRPIPAARTLA